MGKLSDSLSISGTFRLLAATSMLGMMVFVPGPAIAADVTGDESNQYVQGPYFSITGAYLFNESDDNLSFDPDDDKVGAFRFTSSRR